MKEIKLAEGKVVLVDDDDFGMVSYFNWYLNNQGYAAAKLWIPASVYPGGRQTTLLMHRLIMNTPDGLHTDHIDHNKLNNQKDNLRICTRQENDRNRTKTSKSTTSKFKGVCVEQKGNYRSYVATLRTGDGEHLHKWFPFTPEGEIQAAKAYNEMAVKHFGDFAKLNNI